MIIAYIQEALRRAAYDKLEDGSFVAEVDGLQGVIATGDTLERCRDELAEAVEGWILFRVANGMRVPELGGISIAASVA